MKVEINEKNITWLVHNGMADIVVKEFDRLRSEIERLNDSIVLGKAIMPDAEPVE
ncbi:hypothetical protein UFOVP460_34 [uncultured Caudovirales phage]|uniref:Uncharacterized protein n=1 Tax=uncultured Caudovirales phage TaxID=2100421 RepID=A0A6J5MLF6_9CAUD|nr:hypothetical protein UFOVP460_34 [uncultured Caudovirales phage]